MSKPDILELAACPVCTTTSFREIATAAEIREQLEALWQFHTARLKTGAPIRQFFDRAVFSQQPPIHVVQCTSCGTVLRNPREREERVVDVYAEEEPPRAALDALFDAQLPFYATRVSALRQRFGRTGSVLEVGSYLGAFLSAATAAGWRAEGVDVNAGANEFARARGCKVQDGVIEDVQAPEAFDVVAFWNCFDQLPDPVRALRHAVTLAKPGGLVVVRVPNGACYARLLGLPHGLRDLVLAQNNLLALPYRHAFTVDALRRLFQSVGLRVQGIRGDVLVPSAGPWTKPWAAVEEAIAKRVTRFLLPRRLAPWLEAYALNS